MKVTVVSIGVRTLRKISKNLKNDQLYISGIIKTISITKEKVSAEAVKLFAISW